MPVVGSLPVVAGWVGVLETARLRLRRWRANDLLPLAAIYADAEVMRYIGDGSVRTLDQTAASMALMERDWDERGYSMFAVELRDSSELIGWVGLTVPNFLPEILPAVEIGWRLGRGFWGLGYATEAAQQVLRFGFEVVGLDRIVSICHVENVASAHVMSKLGMTLDRVTSVPAHGRRVQVMAISRHQFIAHEAGDQSGTSGSYTDPHLSQ